jgi:hypothetical protein
MWQYEFIGSRWNAESWGPDHLTPNFIGPDVVPEEVSDHFETEIENISLLNDSVDSGWRSKN